MAYRLLADATVAVHAGFLVYLTVGGFLAWRWRWMLWPHVACAAYGLGIVAIGWDCPLTDLENWARVRAGREALPTTGSAAARRRDSGADQRWPETHGSNAATPFI